MLHNKLKNESEIEQEEHISEIKKQLTYLLDIYCKIANTVSN